MRSQQQAQHRSRGSSRIGQMVGKGHSGKEASTPSASSSIWSIFMHSDGLDLLLMLLGLVGSIGDGIRTPAMFLVVSKIMNNIGQTSVSSESRFFDAINKNAINLLYLACGTFVVCFLEGYCWSRTGERQASRMRARYLRAVLRQDVEFFDLQPDNTAQVIRSVSSDSLVIQEVLAEKLPNFLMNASTLLASYAMALVLAWRLALVALPTVLVLMVPGLVYGKVLLRISRKIRDEYDKAGTIVEQAVSSVRTVYSCVGEERTSARFSEALEGPLRLGLKQGLAKGLAIGSNGITFSIWAFMAWYGSKMVMYHGAQGGTIFAAGAAVIMGGLSLGSGLSNVKYFSEAASAGERVMQVINRVPKIDSDSIDGDILQEVEGEVEYKGVEFAYPSRSELLVFESFDLRVPAGKTQALVGQSGSGKSTVIALLERFYDPSKGEILLDGVDIRKLNLKWLRSRIGLVSQEPVLFATSIAENILFGKEDATMEEVVAAAKAANAHNFISQLPQGYDTQVGERGVQMSGGQKQRIAIARAIIKSPKILLLDEATSALDSESERVVQAALDLAAVGRTTIIIAHRLSTVRNADSIAVLQMGKVVESGPHHRLILDHDGPYSTLLRLQDQLARSPIPSASLADNIRSSHSLSRRLSSAAVSRSSSMSSFHMNQINPTPPSPPPPPMPSFRRLIKMNKPEWKQSAIGSICATLFGAIQPVYAFTLGSTLSVYFLADDNRIKNEIRKYSLTFVGLTFFSLAINIGQHYNLAYMGEHLTKRVREKMLKKILTFEVAWFDNDRNSTGAICARLAKDASVVRSLVGDRLALLIQTISAITIACTMGLVIAWRLALVMIVVQPLIITCFYFRKVLLSKISGKAIKAQGESSKVAAEAVSNVRTITAFSSQDRILSLFDRAQAGPRRESAMQSIYAGLGLGTSNGLMMCTWALAFWYGGKLISQGCIDAKDVFQTFLILVSTGRVIADAGTMTTDLAKGTDAVASVFDVLDRRTGIDPDDPSGWKPEGIRGEIEFRDVHFTYPARPEAAIFKGFSLLIQSGKSTALVGQSGSGKSTVIALIERFYDPTKGSVWVDRHDVRSYDLRTMRRHIALVGQEPTLFSGTIRDNIAYGTETATDAEIEAAARAANAHGFISGLGDGYMTACGERGVQLSGGQKQRIAVARAILRGPAVLLLDEATSALDGAAEREVQAALEEVMVGRTSMVVAHRLSTVRGCDAIAVVEKGEVVEKGMHEELFAKRGTYYSLVSLQQQGSSSGM